MQEGFDVLVGQVRNAIDLLKKLRREKKTLAEDLAQSQAREKGLEARLSELEAQLKEAAGRNGNAEALQAQLRELEKERLDVGGRVSRLTELLESLDA